MIFRRFESAEITAKVCQPMTEHTNDLSDEELVAACRADSEAAWEKIVYKYQNLTFSILRRAELDSDAASDVLQEVFKTLFERLASIEQPQFLRAWLTTTARHKTIHYIQKEKRRKIYSPFDEDNEIKHEIAGTSPLPDGAHSVKKRRRFHAEAQRSQRKKRSRRRKFMLSIYSCN